MSDRPPTSRPPRPVPRWFRWAPPAGAGLVGLVLGGAATSQLRSAEYANDLGLHLSLTRLAAERIADGHLPFDGWYAPLSLGSPMLHQYQSLPHAVVAAVGQVVGVEVAFRWSTVLLLALWPVSVFVGARLLGLRAGAAVAAAALAPLLRSVYGYGLEPTGATWAGLGLWPQLWATALLPIALGLSWRAVATTAEPGPGPAPGVGRWRRPRMVPAGDGRGAVVAAGVAAGAVLAFHNVSGAVAVIAVLAWVVGPGRSGLRRRAVRGGLVVVAALGSVLWVIVPSVLDGAAANRPGLDRPTIDYVSYGASTLLRWAVSGELLEAGRLSVVTVAAGLGLLIAVGGRDRLTRRLRAGTADAARRLAVLLALCFAGMVGTSLPVIGGLLPGQPDLYLRLVIGVQLAGLLLAGVGVSALVEMVVTGLRDRPWSPLVTGPAKRPSGRFTLARRAKAGVLALAGAAVVVGAGMVVVGLWTTAADLSRQSSTITQQRAADRTDGADLLTLLARSAGGGGRVFAGSATGWGPTYRIGFVPVYAVLANHDVESIGFWFRTSSLSTMVEPNFDEARPDHYSLFDVRYVVAPVGRLPQVPAEEIDRQGRHVLYRVTGTGRAVPVEVAGTVVADAADIGERVMPFLQSPLPAAGVHPRLVLGDGRPAGTVLAPPPPPGARAPGTARLVRADPAGGRYDVEVDLARPATVLLKSSYHPRWRVTVDGVRHGPEAVVPSYVGREVPAGRHLVSFVYVPVRYGPLLVLSLVVVAATAARPRRWGPGRRRPWSLRARRASR